jgi:hypothetical protein
MLDANDDADGVFKVESRQFAFANLIALEARWTGNRLGKRFPVDLTLEVDELVLTIPKRRPFLNQLRRRMLYRASNGIETVTIRVKLRHCYVRYHSNEISVISKTKYYSLVDKECFSYKENESENKKVANKIGATLSAMGSHQLFASGTTIAGQLNADVGRDFYRELKTSAQLQPEFLEVQPVPNGWRLGDLDWGDPTTPSRCLSGRYFQRATRDFPQTCECEFDENHKKGKIAFAVTIRDGLRVERVDGAAVGETYKESALVAMRDRIASIKIEKELQKENGSAAFGVDAEAVLGGLVCRVEQARDAVEEA